MRDEGLEGIVSPALKTEGGSWTDWRDAWREMGRTEAEIAAEDARRDVEAAAQHFVKGAGKGSRRPALRPRTRTWGKADENIVRMRARLAPLAGYFLRALRNEFSRPSWGIGGRAEMTLRRLYELATCRGVFGADDAVTRWRDFGRVREWCGNALRNFSAWGFRRDEAEIARAWLGNPDADAPMIFPEGTAEAARKAFRARLHGVEARTCSQDCAAHFTDTHARESFYESKKLSDDTTPAEAGFSPLARKPYGLTPLVGARAFTVPEGDSNFSAIKGSRGAGGAGTDAAGGAGACGAERDLFPGTEERVRSRSNRVFCAEREKTGSAHAAGTRGEVEKFEGKLPRRLWWLVWKWYPAFRAQHVGKAVAWSGAHFIAWFKSCLVAGKRCGELFDLYEEKLLRWHGLASDWRIAQETLHPKGLFAELYRAAAGLESIKRQASGIKR